ncbi:DASH complex subunit Ask1-domain-containing protein [Zychaea mexicana]|uniref:DASH complex subunit Ask1-domain-containing protein n=1 Tax=Zychaea mexicana TaxID=64656 RepID=UPI0022FF38F4|nr:DASH complex subunit Ask1-domain-containing protein [Zychaea mexicana]KAI9499652.1 DASH complex subunit Ask1-domain-containing protein [Zychaea mexicana]
MAKTDEETNAELVKLQQEITFTLHTIDEHFARCVRIVSQGIIPEVDRYAAHSKIVWDGLQTWLHFFQHVENNTRLQQTNRPPLDPNIPQQDSADRSPWDRFRDRFSPTSQDLSRILRRPALAYPHGSRTTASSTTLARPQASALASSNLSNTTSDASSTSSFRRRTSPPKTIPFRLSPNELLQTPAREAARMMVNNKLRRIGAMSPSSGSSEDPESSSREQQQQQHQPQRKDGHGNETPASWVDQNNESDRGHFEEFMRVRQERYQHMDLDIELPVFGNRPAPKSPGRQRHQDTQEQDFAFAISDIGSPSINMDQDLRPSAKRIRDDMDCTSLLPSPSVAPDTRDQHNAQGVNVNDENDSHDEVMSGPYEFTQIPPTDLVAQTDERQSETGTPAGSVGGISVSSSASQLPREFSLHYFASSYREPPASTQLTRIYTLFADRPGRSMSADQVLELLENDQSFTIDRIKLFIDVLTTKKFLRKESAGRWLLRI